MYPLSGFFIFTALAAVNALPGPSFRPTPAPANTTSPVSNVKGKAFDRMVIIWLENTDFDKAAGDRKNSPQTKSLLTLTAL